MGGAVESSVTAAAALRQCPLSLSQTIWVDRQAFIMNARQVDVNEKEKRKRTLPCVKRVAVK